LGANKFKWNNMALTGAYIYDRQNVMGSKFDEGQHFWNDTGYRDVRVAGHGVPHPDGGAIAATRT